MIRNKSERWENYVNSYIFANFEKLERWIAKRQVADNTGTIYNYIQFPKPENGRILTKSFLEFMIQIMEWDDDVCENIFGPKYKRGTAEIIDDGENLSIVWNKHLYEDLLDEAGDDETGGSLNTMMKLLYDWDIWTGVPTNLSKEEIERRKKIDAELNRMAVVLNDPKLGTVYRSPKQMEAIYNNYRFEGFDD